MSFEVFWRIKTSKGEERILLEICPEIFHGDRFSKSGAHDHSRFDHIHSCRLMLIMTLVYCNIAGSCLHSSILLSVGHLIGIRLQSNCSREKLGLDLGARIVHI